MIISTHEYLYIVDNSKHLQKPLAKEKKKKQQNPRRDQQTMLTNIQIRAKK